MMLVPKLRRCLISLMCVLLVFVFSVPSYAETSNKKSHWAAQRIEDWKAKNLLDMKNGAVLLPDQAVTRGEIIALINNLFGFKEQAEISFVDVPNHAWYQEDLRKAVHAGYLKGVLNSKGQLEAKADQKVTRQEGITLIAKAFQFTTTDNNVNSSVLEKFTDFNNIAPYALNTLAVGVSNGYLTGFPDNTIRPRSYITLAEAITILNNISGEIITRAGTYTRQYDRNVVVNANNVILKNATITGDLFVTEGVGSGELTLDQVVVKGNLYIRGGGENSVKLLDSIVEGKMEVNKQDGKVRVYTSGQSRVATAELYSGAIVETQDENFDNVIVKSSDSAHSVKFLGNYPKVTVASVTTKVSLDQGSIEHLEVIKPSEDIQSPAILLLNKGTTISKMVVRNSLQVSGEGVIKNADVYALMVTFENEPLELNTIQNGITTSKNNQQPTAPTISEVPSGGGSSGGGSSGGGGGSGGSGSDDSESGNGPGIPVNPDQEDVLQATSQLTLEGDLSNTTANLPLPTSGLNETLIQWESNNPAVLLNDGTVFRPELGMSDVQVVLTAKVSKGVWEERKQFVITVKAIQQVEVDEDDKRLVSEAREALNLGDINNVSDNLILPLEGLHNTVITWVSQNKNIVTDEGHIFKLPNEDRTAILIAHISKGRITEEKTFIIIVKSDSNNPISNELIEARDLLALGEINSVTKDVYLPSEGLHGITISWQSNDSNVITNEGKVTRPELGKPDSIVTLTAILSKGGEVTSKAFTLTVIAKRDAVLEKLSFNNYAAIIDDNKKIIHLIVPANTDLSLGTIAFEVKNGTLAVGGIEVTSGSQLSLKPDQKVTLLVDGTEEDVYHLVVTKLDTGIPSIIINTVNNRPILDKENKIRAAMTLLDGTTFKYETGLYDGEITIKGRGNSSWWMPKKSYAISAPKSVPMLDMPKEEDWVLIANYADKSLMRNYIAYQLGESMGMKYSPRMRFVDLFVNGEYLGNYLLGEKIDISKSRLNINKLKANDTDGENITGGYLIEKDWLQRLKPDDLFFNTTKVKDRNVFAIKKPKANKINDEQLQYISSYFEEAEEALYGPNFADEKNGYSKYFDINSLIDWYLVNEIFKNVDAAFGTSVYLYKDRGGKISMGPLWDFDIGAGNIDFNDNDLVEDFYIKNGLWISRFFEDPGFVELVKDRWEQIKEDQIPAMFALIDHTSMELDSSQKYNFQKWPILGAYTWPNAAGWEERTTYASEVQYLKDWLTARINWLDKAFFEL